MTSVLQEWVMNLPLREQGALVVAMRGGDEVPKRPLDSTARQLTGYLRFLVMNPADEREVGIEGAFFQDQPPRNWKPSELGHYSLHWFAHLMHGYQICGYRMLDNALRLEAQAVYVKMVHSLHLKPESFAEMKYRLSEDRIANGTVVS